jgi:molecular chaperone DnaJ
MKIPPGTQPGAVLRLRGRGMPALRGRGVGDQLVTVKVEIPTRLSPEQRDLVEKLRRT